jgi:drug/metabolite transporter (DMT)-like permease
MRFIRSAPFLIGVLALLWGANFAWIKLALGGFTPVQLTFGRMLLGALVLCAVVRLQRQRLPRGCRLWAHLIVAALVANALPYLLFAIGETRVGSSIAGIANATTPLWALVLVAALRQGERFGIRSVLGFLIGFAGCVVLFAPWNTGGTDTAGTLICLAAAISYAFSYVYMARYLTPYGLNLTVLSAAQLIAATGWTLLMLAPLPGPTPSAQLGAWLALLVLGALGTGAAYVVNYALIHTEGAAGASVVTYLVPITSVIIGAVALGESVTFDLALGTGFILAGVLLTRRRRDTQLRQS